MHGVTPVVYAVCMQTLTTHRATLLAQEAVAIANAGTYVAPSGAVIDLSSTLAAAVEGTVEHLPDEALGPVSPRFETTFEVTGESTLAATRRLAVGGRVAALNFASARYPGGGFLTGALAQEESLCRSSALFVCLDGRPMYGYHTRHNDPVFSDRVIWSPDVPVFRDDEGVLLEVPYRASFLSCPAPNAALILERDGRAGPAIEATLRRRAQRILEVAATHGAETLVLGAWGAGVFGNAPAIVADAFGVALEGPLRGVFSKVVFAILSGRDPSTREVFASRFGVGTTA